MKILAVQKRIMEYDLDAEKFLEFFKQKVSFNDTEVQEAKSLNELINLYGCLDELNPELKEFLKDQDFSVLPAYNELSYFEGDDMKYACMDFYD